MCTKISIRNVAFKIKMCRFLYKLSIMDKRLFAT